MRRERIQRNVLFLGQDNSCLSPSAEASAKIEGWLAPDELKPEKGTTPNFSPYEMSETKSTNGFLRFFLGHWRNVRYIANHI